MSDGLGIGDAPLTVLLDLRNPQSYLALAPTLALGRDLGVEIDWLPLRTPPLRAPSEPSPADDRSVLHRRHRARALAREIETYGAARGLTLRELYRDTDPGAFELGWLWLRERRDARLTDYIGAAMRAWWAVELDPADRVAIGACLAGCGVDTGDFEGWCAREGEALAARVAAALGELGFSGVPGYWVDGEYFQGRQHLPMIRWILEGRPGPGPI